MLFPAVQQSKEEVSMRLLALAVLITLAEVTLARRDRDLAPLFTHEKKIAGKYIIVLKVCAFIRIMLKQVVLLCRPKHFQKQCLCYLCLLIYKYRKLYVF